jgi:hypothetical protein
MTSDIFVVGITAGIASGKSSVVSFLKQKNYNVVDTSEILYNTLTKSGIIEPQRQDYHNFYNQGSTNLDDLLIPTIITSINEGRNVIDSVKTIQQDDILRKSFHYVLIYLNTPIEKRFELNQKRSRFKDDKSMTFDDFLVYIQMYGESQMESLKQRSDFVLDFFDEPEKRHNSLISYLSSLK